MDVFEQRIERQSTPQKKEVNPFKFKKNKGQNRMEKTHLFALDPFFHSFFSDSHISLDLHPAQV
jgi:hypothetical protein